MNDVNNVSGVVIVYFEHITHLFSIVFIFHLEQVNVFWEARNKITNVLWSLLKVNNKDTRTIFFFNVALVSLL